MIEDVHLAGSDAEIARCFAVLQQLRPHLERDTFIPAIRAQQSEGYHLAFLDREGAVVAVAGFRIHHVLWSGKTLYVDDLVTDANLRSRGHGEALLHWLMDYARREACETLSLDSGTQRQSAHAFYFRHGLRISSFHFQRSL